MSYPKYQYDLIRAIVVAWKEAGVKTVYRHELTKAYSAIMRKFDPNHTDTTRGEHIGEMMQKVAKSLGGSYTQDLTKNGNAKKNSVRIEF